MKIARFVSAAALQAVFSSNIHINTWKSLELSSGVGAAVGALFGYWWCSPGMSSGPIDLSSLVKPPLHWTW